MAQERPGGLAVISTNNDVSQNLLFDAVIDDFASKKSRCVQFWNYSVILKIE